MSNIKNTANTLVKNSIEKLEYRVESLERHLSSMAWGLYTNLGRDANTLLYKLERAATEIRDAVGEGKAGAAGVHFAASEINDIINDLHSVEFLTMNERGVKLIFILAEDIVNDLEEVARNMNKKENQAIRQTGNKEKEVRTALEDIVSYTNMLLIALDNIRRTLADHSYSKKDKKDMSYCYTSAERELGHISEKLKLLLSFRSLGEAPIPLLCSDSKYTLELLEAARDIAYKNSLRTTVRQVAANAKEYDIKMVEAVWLLGKIE